MKRIEKKKPAAKPKEAKKKEEKKKHITHDMKLRSVIFASGTPGKDEEHDFLISRNHNHPAIGCIPRVKLGEDDWYFVLEISEHEKDRRRKYSRSSNRGLCRWKLQKSDVLSIRTFEGFSVTDPGPMLDFSRLQSTMVEGTEENPISIDDSDGPEEGKEKAAEKEEEDAAPEPTAIVVETVAEPTAVVAPAVEEQEEVEEIVEEPAIEEPDDLDPDTLESLKVTELREKCKERDLYAKGLKRELVSRLKEYLTEKAKRVELQKTKVEPTKEVEEGTKPISVNLFPDTNVAEDDDDIIVEENEPPAEKEVAEGEKAAEKMEEDKAEDKENKEGEAMETENAAEGETAEKAAEGEEAAEAMEVEAQEEEDQDVALALLDVENIDDSLKSICTIVNDVQNEGSAYWFVPDLTSVDSWEGNEEHLKAYTDKIEQPMSFTQVKAQIEDGTLDSEEKVVEAVMLIFKNAKEFNEEGSEWFDNASNVEHHFNELLENLDVERKLTEVDENGKLKFAEMPPHYLKKIAEKGGEKYAADVNHETLLKFAEDAVEKLGKEKEDFDAKELVLSIHRVFFEEAQAVARDPGSKNNAFYVALALNHELRQIHHDRDVISNVHTDKARVILLEFRKDITSGKLDDIKSNWLKVMKSGPAKGIETKDVYGEAGEFESLMDKLVVASNEFYKKEKRFATTEELIATNKKLRGNKDSLEKRLKEKVEENRQLRKLLDDISRLSDYRKQLKK